MINSNTDVAVKEKIKAITPKMYHVVFHNDDATPMDFVVSMLRDIFDYAPDDSFEIMMKVHTDGAATVGTYTKEIAETKNHIVMESATTYGFDQFKTTVEGE